MFFPLVELWKKRSLIAHFSVLNLKLRFKGTYLGLFWAALEPLFIFSILFTVITTIREVKQEDFAIYLIVGVLFYHLFTRGTIGGLQSLVNNTNILKSIKIEKEIFPVIATGTIFIFMLVELLDLFLLMPIFSFVPTWTTILLIPLLALFLVLILGVSYYLSIFNVFIRDVQQIWSVLVYALLFISPIFWYVSDVDGILLSIHQVNPLGQLIELAHKVIVFGEVGSISEWAYALALVLGIFFSGFVLFKKFENKVVEKL
ncbi:ABC transporter permease [Nitrosopumilus sp. K4]|uniref:ABC transporter permease n=1 Tax=Nitrosopumilus sp. K4 TaxID=2795383 RepID=UPI001BA72B05|nr:ABC transporter permease [Nitrosopumilus sp. K4]QUC64799.1 ABC transporter permease [Nitrosopumilus sp. K4]